MPSFSGATVGHEEIATRIGLRPNQRARVRRFLDKRGIPYFEENGAIFTTIDALNAALGVSGQNDGIMERSRGLRF